MLDLIKYAQTECCFFFDSVVESFSSILLEEYPELITYLCNAIRGTEDVCNEKRGTDDVCNEIRGTEDV